MCVYLTAAQSKKKLIASPFVKPNTIPFSEFLFPPFLFCVLLQQGTAVAQWLRFCATVGPR